MFSRIYRLEIHVQSVMLVFSTQLCELCPFYNLLSGSPPPHPQPKKSRVFTDSVWLGGVVGVLSCVGDHILQEVNTLFLTRFRTYKIATPPQTKTQEERGPQADKHLYTKVPLQVNFFQLSFSLIFLRG